LEEDPASILKLPKQYVILAVNGIVTLKLLYLIQGLSLKELNGKYSAKNY
jgi:hypothetical protein